MSKENIIEIPVNQGRTNVYGDFYNSIDEVVQWYVLHNGADEDILIATLNFYVESLDG